MFSIFSPKIYRRFIKERSILQKQFDPTAHFEELEESCIPSYTHRNQLLGWVAWQRLEIAVLMARPNLKGARVLDFGSGSGVLAGLLPESGEYNFVEQDESLCEQIGRRFPNACRKVAAEIEEASFDVIFALDSLEHNEDIDTLLEQISKWLRPNGVFVLSGPSENFLYRIGRRLAGFEGGYHEQTIYDIESAAGKLLHRKDLRSVPLSLPLFRISTWQPMDKSE